GEVADVRPHLRRAAVVVVPVRMGGGTRLKVLEGLAMAKPMVSTTLGCEGVNVDDGEHLLVRNEASAFADAVISLFDQQARSQALGRGGRERMAREYSWDLAGARQEELYRRVADQRARRRTRFALGAAEAAASSDG